MITAFDFAQKKAENGIYDDFWYEAMIEFAKLHVEAVIRAQLNQQLSIEDLDAFLTNIQ